MPRFTQINDVTKTGVVPVCDRLQHPSPFVDLKKIPDCKSFEMSNKALTQTIRTLLKADMGSISHQGEIYAMVENRLA